MYENILFFSFIFIFREDHKLLSSKVQELMLFYEHPLFIYPQLLPTRTFCRDLKTFPIQLPEEKYLQLFCLVNSKHIGCINYFFFRLLILLIDHMFKRLKESPGTRTKYKKMNLSDMMPIVLPIVHKRWFSHRKLPHLKSFLTRRRTAFEENITKVCSGIFSFFKFKNLLK